MDSPATVQQAMNQFLEPEGLDSQRRKVCAHLQACRTEMMGESVYRCEHYECEQHLYHGCRDRHCPQCQTRATQQWVERQQQAVLPVAYHHVVFTLPHALNGWIQLHPDVIYRLLFQCAWQTIKAFGEDPKRLGGQMGMTAVLHTWGQNLSQHVHLHCLVPAGALAEDGAWKAIKGNYLFPVKAMSRYFRGHMVSGLRQSANNSELSRVSNPGEIDNLLNTLMEKEWVVYSKHCLSHTESVVEYLGRYSHRIAITNHRILSVDEQGVLLRYKDYRAHGRQKTLYLEGEEFVRRYLLHILPKGFMRIRHFGFLANSVRDKRVNQIKKALAEAGQQSALVAVKQENAGFPCPACKQGYLHLIAVQPAQRRTAKEKRRR